MKVSIIKFDKSLIYFNTCN